MKKKIIKKILIISHYYYPDDRVGAKRFGNLVEIFEKNFSEIHILTIPEKQIPKKDPSLSPSGIVHHAPMIPPPPPYPKQDDNIIKKVYSRLWEKHLCTIDRYVGWLIPGLFKALDIIKRNNIDLIIATSPPFTSLIVGALASFLTGKKLILDYRDPWTSLPRKYPEPFGKIVSTLSEKFAVNRADAMVFCSDIMKDDFTRIFRDNGKTRYYVLTNGFKELKNAFNSSMLNKKKYTMLYAGNLYRGRSIDLIAEPLYSLKKKYKICKNSFEFVIFGNVPYKDLRTINKLKIQDLIRIEEILPYNKILSCIKEADVLFLPSADEHKYAIPYKFFDYIMSKRPILAVGPEGSAIENIMEKINCGKFCPANRSKLVENTLEDLLKNNSKCYRFIIHDYRWENIGNKYIEIINF